MTDMNLPDWTPKPGATIAHYKITDRLGVGGMGEVFLAQDTKLNRKIALKFLPTNLASDPSIRARFMREAQSAAALNHPNIVTIFEVGEENGRVFIAMEYVQGKNLRDIIDSGELTLDRVIDISIQLCGGLQAAHTAGQVHRDIKPLNIIVDHEDRVRILDFGLAKTTGDEQLTQAGMAMGTVQYMSPEQGLGQEVDRRSDIFSVGIVIYEMAAQKRPFNETSIPATIYAIVHEPHIPIEEAVPNIPPGLKAVIDRALAKQVDKRYQHISQMREELKMLAGGSTTQGISMATQAIDTTQAISTATQAIGSSTAAIVAQQPAMRSVAVLHLRNLGSPDDEFVSYGITEDLIVDLTRLGTIRVSPMRSVMKFKDSDAEIEEIAEKLNVTLVLDGSIHKTDTAIRVSAQLIDVQSGNNLWAERWQEPLEKLPNIKHALAEGITNALNFGANTVMKAAVGVPESKDAAAYELYLKAKFAFESKSDKNDVETALSLYRQAVEAEPSLLAARAGLAQILMYKGSLGEAHIELKAALADATKRGLKTEMASLSRLLARLYISQSNYPEAWSFGSKALELTKEAGDLAGEAETLGVLISILQPQAKFDEAVGLFERVLQINRKLDDHDQIANALKNMGVAYSRQGDYNRALGLYEEALEMARSRQDISMQAACLSNIGNVYYFQGDLDQAFRKYGEALEMNSRLGDKAGTARQNLNMGLVQLQQGNFREGLELLEVSATFFEAMGDKGNFALTLTNISQARLRIGEDVGAIEAADRALEIAKSIKHPLAESGALFRLGAAYLYQREFDKAKEVMIQALVVAEQANISRSVAALEAEMATLYYLKKDYAASRKHADRAQTVARELGDKTTLTRAAAYVGALTIHEGLFNAGISQIERQISKANDIGDVDLSMHLALLHAEALLASDEADDKTHGRDILTKNLKLAEERELAPEKKWIKELLSLSESQ